MNDIKMPISQVRELLTGGGRELAREKTEGKGTGGLSPAF